MIYDCPTCAAALLYNPALGKLECLSCYNIYDVKDFSDPEEKEIKEEIRFDEAKQNHIENKDTLTNEDMMECNIYNCTACGAELAINDVEAATYCAYCGQPTIVFNRVSSTLKPKYIIPFSVTQNQAVKAIRSHLNRGFFISDEIKNFEIERVRGIYLPFWLYDIKYSDQQYLKGEVGSGKNRRTKYFYRNAECSFHNVTLDASKQLNDESSQRLEPYNPNALRPFETGYLSGFYADCYDIQSEQLDGPAIIRVKRLFDAEIKKTVHASDVQIVHNAPQYTITKTDYALFPAWFMTFRHENEPYTILVNGQTGKVIGAVPYDKPRTRLYFWIIGIIASILATLIAYSSVIYPISNLNDLESSGTIAISILAICYAMYKTGHNKFKQVHNSIQLSKSTSMNQFVKDRQEGN